MVTVSTISLSPTTPISSAHEGAPDSGHDGIRSSVLAFDRRDVIPLDRYQYIPCVLQAKSYPALSRLFLFDRLNSPLSNSDGERRTEKPDGHSYL